MKGGWDFFNCTEFPSAPNTAGSNKEVKHREE